MKPASIPLQTIARFSKSGQVFRSFGYFLAASGGSLLAVPVCLGSGDFLKVVDRCPVPWFEALAVIESPRSDDFKPLQPEQLAKVAPLVAALFPPYGWVQDAVSLNTDSGPLPRVISPDGVLFSWVPNT